MKTCLECCAEYYQERAFCPVCKGNNAITEKAEEERYMRTRFPNIPKKGKDINRPDLNEVW